MEAGDIAHRHRAKGIAMVGIGQSQIAGFSRLGIWSLLLVLQGDFQGGLHGGGAIITEKNPGESHRSAFDQAAGQFHRRNVRGPQQSRMRHLPSLAQQRSVKLRHPVAMQIAP